MKFRWWPHTPDARIASTRLRCLRVMAALRDQGLDVGLFDPDEDAPAVLVLAKRYDEATLVLARKLRVAGTKLILDLCDNHFYCEPPSPAWHRRANALRAAVATVDVVTVSTKALAEVVHAECPDAPPVYVVGDAVEPACIPSPIARWRHPLDELTLLRLQRRLQSCRGAGMLLLLWFGNHGSENAEGGMLDLLRIREPLRAMAARQRLCLTVISNNHDKFATLARELGVPCGYLPWTAGTFSRAAALHDIAILPIGINPFTVCKTNNRMTTALMHGLAVVADPIPSYREFEGSAILGDWAAGLATLCADKTLRQSMVEQGRRRIAAHWLLPEIAGQWRRILEAVVICEALNA